MKRLENCGLGNVPGSWICSRLIDNIRRLLTSCSPSSWREVARRMPKGSILGFVLLVGICIKLAGGTKLGDVVHIPENRIRIQDGLNIWRSDFKMILTDGELDQNKQNEFQQTKMSRSTLGINSQMRTFRIEDDKNFPPNKH